MTVKLIIATILVIVVSSCSSRSSSSFSDKNEQDSIKKVNEMQERREQMRQDSIKAQFAWGEIPFGISLLEAKEYPAFKNSKVDGKDILEMSSEETENVAKAFSLNNLSSIKAYFSDKQLYKIVLESYPTQYDGVKDLISDLDTLAEKLTPEYGKMNTLNRPEEISLSTFEEGKYFNYGFFMLGICNSKDIHLNLGESYAGGYYRYMVEISNSGYPKRNDADIKKQRDEQNKG